MLLLLLLLPLVGFLSECQGNNVINTNISNNRFYYSYNGYNNIIYNIIERHYASISFSCHVRVRDRRGPRRGPRKDRKDCKARIFLSKNN